MGAETFVNMGSGTTAQEAFRSVKRRFVSEDGYSGTIAEKESIVAMGTAATRAEALAMAENFIDNDDPKISSKWGPAGYIRIDGTDKYVFFGWASC
jgi:hypothetical protein